MTFKVGFILNNCRLMFTWCLKQAYEKLCNYTWHDSLYLNMYIFYLQQCNHDGINLKCPLTCIYFHQYRGSQCRSECLNFVTNSRIYGTSLNCGEKISWTDHVRNEEVKRYRNILHEISKQKAKWIGHILCTTGYWRKDKRVDRSERKTRKKTWEATGWPVKERILSFEGGSSRSHYVKSSL